MKFEDYKLMSIGSYCLGVYALGSDRIKGPVDNVLLDGVKALELLFDNKYLTYLKQNKPQEILKKYTQNEESNYDFYFPGVVKIVHNDIKNEKYFIHLKDRVDIFNNFLKDFKKDNKKFFVFFISYLFIDIKTGKPLNNKLEYIINFFKSKGILDKVIFVDSSNQKQISRQTWWNNYLNDVELKKLKNKYNLNYINLKNLNLATAKGKQETNDLFKKQFINLINQKNKKEEVTKLKQVKKEWNKNKDLDFYYGLFDYRERK